MPLQAELNRMVEQVFERGTLEVPWQGFRDRHFQNADEQFARTTMVRWFAEKHIRATAFKLPHGGQAIEVIQLTPHAGQH